MTLTDSKTEPLDPWDAITAPEKRRFLPSRLGLQGAKRPQAVMAAAAAVLLASGISTGATWLCLEVARHDAGSALQTAVTTAQPQVDLAPKMVTALRNDPPLEQDTVDEVVLARNALAVHDPGADGSSGTFSQYADADLAISTSLEHLVARAQEHPALVASPDFTALVHQLNDMTPVIDAANADYNEAAQRYNSFRESFPGNLLAPLLGHGEPFGYLEEL